MWYVYIVRCSKDDSLYTGITLNIEERIKKHNNGTGAKYCRGRTPVVLIKFFVCENKSSALKLEYHIKKLSREEKLNYVQES
jgi:putative endonuclease